MKTPKDVKFIYLPESTEQALTNTLPEMVDNVDGLLIIPKLQDQNFENLQKQTQLLVNKNIGFDVKQNIAFSMSEVIKKKKSKIWDLQKLKSKILIKTSKSTPKMWWTITNKIAHLLFGVKSGLSMGLMYV